MNNTVKRTLSGICFLVVVIGCLLIDKYLYAALLTFMMVTMLHEFYRMTMGNLFPRTRALAIVLGCCSFLSLFLVMAFRLDIRLVGISAILLLVLMSSTLMVKDKADFKLFAFLYTGLMYIGAPLTLSNFVVFSPNGVFDGRPMLAFFIIIWASDVGAYCVGMLFGKYSRKLFESVSPKKTWAGFWGGLAFAVLAGLILVWTGLWTYPWYHAIVLSVIMHVAGVFGDLFESQWKRVCEIKDSGNIIPGHGGMLDRFDSALFAIPAGVIYLVIIGLL
ncbi:MAG: phosphatidate cytidylyltransferase [Bacteroidales bacterium]|jgi:phosphatidate cytidylyltransferase|nr:phosphatidate cytidylyltransferase [Bacteroidales bacterium]MBR6863834.1 phosphatidate cytidylyltransferase [Bacteroidales bacterium]